MLYFCFTFSIQAFSLQNLKSLSNENLIAHFSFILFATVAGYNFHRLAPLFLLLHCRLYLQQKQTVPLLSPSAFIKTEWYARLLQ